MVFIFTPRSYLSTNGMLCVKTWCLDLTVKQDLGVIPFEYSLLSCKQKHMAVYLIAYMFI